MSASPVPMSCRAQSLKVWIVTLLCPVMTDLPVVRVVTWQAEQPIFVNTCCPCATVVPVDDDVEVLEVEEVDVEEVEDAAAAIAELAVAAATCVEDDEDVAGVLEVAGVGGASMRMKAAKLTMSCEKSEAGLPLLVLLTRLVVLSGKLLNWQLGVSSRSCGKASLVTPISTL